MSEPLIGAIEAGGTKFVCVVADERNNILDQRVFKLTPQCFSYTLTKAALLAATATMAQSLAPDIRVNAVAPGIIDTPMVRGLPAKVAAVADDSFLTQKRAAATNRLGHADDVAHLVLFLASDESRFINGQSHVIDDGASIITGETSTPG